MENEMKKLTVLLAFVVILGIIFIDYDIVKEHKSKSIMETKVLFIDDSMFCLDVFTLNQKESKVEKMCLAKGLTEVVYEEGSTPTLVTENKGGFLYHTVILPPDFIWSGNVPANN